MTLPHPLPLPRPLPRFEAVSRRHFLRQSLVAVGGLTVAGSALAACSDNDAEVFGASDTIAPPPSSAAATTVTPETTAAPESTLTTSVDDGLFPPGAELQVDFTYVASESGGRIRNPYIAVWVENPTGELVQTIALWYSAREAKYVRGLNRWYAAELVHLDGGGTDNVESISGATRTAGNYSVVWDGTDVDGNIVAQGDYVICVESAREHGPRSLSVGAVTIGASGFSTALPDDGELSAVVVNIAV